MKIDLADSSKEPSLKELNCIMLEVAEEARMNQKLAAASIEKAIKLHLAELKKNTRFKLKNLL
jgi:hypothetical protein